jgi:hypothetical protein
VKREFVDLTEQEKRYYQRMLELSRIARQRYLDADGDPHHSSGSLHNNSHMTDEERREFLELGQRLSKLPFSTGS